MCVARGGGGGLFERGGWFKHFRLRGGGLLFEEGD